MPIKLFLIRLLSNLLDLVLFLILFILINLLAGLEQTEGNIYYVFFVTFIICFVIPLITVRNTFGKIIVGLSWQENLNSKLFLCFKYCIYLSFVFPGFSVIAMVKDFPYLHSHRADLAVNLIFLAVYIIIDLFLFCYSVGRYHLLDYIFYLQLNGHGYKRKGQLSLITILSAISIFVCIHFAVFRYQTNFANLMDHFIADLHVENFPQAIYSNNKCVVIKQKSANVILPTVLHSFLFNKEYEQKTIYLYLPLTIFNSEKDRETICNEVLMQSKRNDVFFRYSPTQTRIIASTFKQGKFLEYYNYFYIYYHYSDLPEWGINGGLRADSTVVNKYVDFVYGCNENLRNRIKSYNPNSKDLDLNDKIISTSFTTTIHHNKVEIKSNNTKMAFDKIEFSKVEMHGSASINFPPKAFMYQMDFRDILNNEIVESDENVSNLIFARSEVSNPNL